MALEGEGRTRGEEKERGQKEGEKEEKEDRGERSSKKQLKDRTVVKGTQYPPADLEGRGRRPGK